MSAYRFLSVFLMAAVVPALAQRGRDEFKQACGFCHGEDGTGARAPDLIRSPVLSHDINGDQLGPVILNGRPDKGMPAFHMSAAQIAGIAAFLHQQARAALNSAQVPGDYPAAKLLTGNAEAGRAYFNGAGGCAKCHSPTGDLAGIASRYAPLALQNRMLYPAGRRTARVPRSVRVTLPSGKAYTGRLEHLDEFSVALVDAAGWYHSWARTDGLKVLVSDPLEQHRELLYCLTDSDIHNLFAYLETLK